MAAQMNPNAYVCTLESKSTLEGLGRVRGGQY